MPIRHYDLIVLGTGTGGGTVARMCADQGWNVLNIENRTPGGTCAQRGCDAKKPFVEAAALADACDRLRGHGLAGTVKIDWSALVNFKNSFTEIIPAKERKDLQERGMDLVEGNPRFIDPNTLKVNDTHYRAPKIVIATGRIPRPMSIPGAEWMTTSDAFLQLSELPPRLLFVGGGYVSMELAHVAARLNHDIHVVQGPDRILSGFDKDLVNMLVESSRSLGIHFHFNSPVKAIERTKDGFKSICGESGLTLESDLVVHGAGRVPSTMDLDAGKGQVKCAEDGGIVTNQYLQSPSNPAVYAVGDCAASPGAPLTPVANLEAEIVGTNLLEGNHAQPNYLGVASVVFTCPPLAKTGLTEEEAKHKNDHVDVRFQDWTSRKIMRQSRVSAAGAKVLLEKGSGRILGGHFFGPEAADMANCVAIGIRNNLTARQLGDTIYAYPTLTGLIKSLFS